MNPKLIAQAADLRAFVDSTAPQRVRFKLTEKDPVIANHAAVITALQRAYPVGLRDQGKGGTITFVFLVDEKGRVIRKQIVGRSDYIELDHAAASVMDIIRIEPPATETCVAKYLGQMPLVFMSR